MAYLVIHAIQQGRPTGPLNFLGEHTHVPHQYEPGEIFEPTEFDDVPALLAAGVLAEDDEEGRARLAAADAARERTRSPYGLL